MSHMEDILENQQQLLDAIERIFTNFKKDSSDRKTSDYIRRRAEAEDVIDLGAPRLLRRAPSAPLAGQPPTSRARTRSVYTPNPRLYPGLRARPKRSLRAGGSARGRRHKRVFRRPVPNARLYRPAPRRAPPPPTAPRASWPPPAPPARLDTASRAALRLSEQRRARPSAPSPPREPPATRRVPSSPRRALPSRRRAPPSPRRAPLSPRRELRSPRPVAHSPPLARRSPCSPPPRSPAPEPAPLDASGRRLVVTLPTSATGESPRRYRPASEHFRLRSLDTESGASTPVAGRLPRRSEPAMEPGNRHSTSPEDCSDGNETLSAPSEFLAEFLSAIMRRQYAEALKYCRLILQYEPHNATARGFYPLLQHKVQGKRTEGAEWRRGSSSEEASAGAGERARPPAHAQEVMQQGGDSSPGSEAGCAASRPASRSARSAGSVGSQSSLELDSSDAPAHSSPSLSFSRRTDHSDSAASAGCWESTGSASRSEPDDNGNAPPPAPAPQPARAASADLENDNAPAAEPPSAPHLKNESSTSSLQRLRAQFTCSIK